MVGSLGCIGILALLGVWSQFESGPPAGDQTWPWKIPELNALEVSIGNPVQMGGFYIATFDYRRVYDISQLHQVHMSDVTQLYQSRVTTQLYMSQ